MPIDIRVPALGESIVDAVIATWHKHEGEAVHQGEAILELETDKVNLEVSADQSGVLQKITKQAGEVVTIGEVVGIISEGSASGGEPQKSTASDSQSSQKPIQPSVLAEQARVYPEVSEANGQRSPSPLARRIADEHQVDLSQVKGNNPYGRVTKDDVITYIEQQRAPQIPTSQPPQPTAVAAVAVPPLPLTPPSNPPASLAPTTVPVDREERVRLSRRRQTIAQRLVEAQHTAAMLTTFNDIDMTAVMEVRSRRKDTFKERHQVSLGFMSFFTKAVVGALKAFPRLNAEIQGNEMVLKHHYDIGIAVGAEEGLVVPVLRDADRKSFAEIEQGIGALAKRVRENTLSLVDLQGGTFTITNGGVFGSLLSTPILNAPQVGILGMHKIEQRPIALNGQVVIRPMMYVALSYDHRIVDGREAVQFLVRIKELIEDPETLLLEG